MKHLQKIILILYAALFFIVPLILWPYTSELFEFNKMIVVYIFTALISGAWLLRIIKERKFIFSRTMLDIPLLVFLGSQVISTLLSIDPRTSWLGYYSRFNGGLLSTICYLLLYWGLVSNIDAKGVKKLLNASIISAIIVSIYGVLEHLGIDKNIWQQDVQSRVFSTLGQPNWLAAWLVALMPITWVEIINNQKNKFTFKKTVPYLVFALFFTVLLFTGSRSGLLGFGVAGIIFWLVVLIKSRTSHIKSGLISGLIIIFAMTFFGTQFTPSIFKLIEKNKAATTPTVATGATVMETGGTESGTIRKIVWQGALQIWKHYPVFGTGVETFAYSYYLYRPATHNMTSEWDYIYNKAHNEYLNFMANSGTAGILSYLIVIGFSIYLMYKNLSNNCGDENSSPFISMAFLAGYGSILVTNFFGFSVVPIQLQFFLFPAFSIILSRPQTIEKESKFNPSSNQKLLNWITVFGTACLVFFTCRYWYADYLYATGASYDRINRQDLSPKYLTQAIKLSPKESVYYSELSKAYTSLALAYNEAKETTASSQLTQAAIENSVKAVDLSPANVNLKRIEFSVYVMLSTLNPNYLINAKDTLVTAIAEAPTDAKLYYNLGLIYSRIGQNDLARETLKKTVDLKANYGDARLAYAILLIDAKENATAKEQLQYILANINPDSSMAKQYLESIK